MNGLFIMRDFWETVPYHKKKLLESSICQWARMTLDEQLRYFRSQDSKKFGGARSEIPLLKFRVDEGARIIYTYARDLEHPDIAEDDLDNIVILSYVPSPKHDDQDFLVRRRANWVRPVIMMCEQEDGGVAYPPYLTLKQRDCLKSSFPMLIFSGAGSGKTIVAVRKMKEEMRNADEKEKAVYVTISAKLLDKAKKEYDEIVNESVGSEPEFYTMEELCKSLLHSTEDAINFDEFARDFFSKKIKTRMPNLTALGLWTEIRGVIKGYMGRSWRRTVSVRQDRFNSDFVRLMDKNGLWERRKSEHQARLFLPEHMSVTEWFDNAKEIMGLGSRFDEAAQEVKEYFENAANWASEITLKEYIELGDRNLDTMSEAYSRMEREEIYRLYEQYKSWLKENSLLDENDLAQKVLSSGMREQFPLIVIDEAQDFTQLQTLMLFSLAKPDRYQITMGVEKTFYKMIIAGDVHQTIHPTYFSLEHLRQLFFNTGKKAVVSSLTESHRSYSEVLRAANALSGIRRDKIGRMDGATEDPPDVMRNGGKAFTLKNDAAYLQGIINSLDSVPDHAVIVPNESEKKRFKSGFNSEGQQVNVFTVEEMKGLELKFVICFNILSAHEEAWHEIMTQDVKKQAQYRFYFNLLYVAVTRAVKYVCIFEEKYEVPGLRLAVRPFEDVGQDYFYEEVLKDIEAYDPEAWLESARKLEDAEKYEEAIRYFEKAGRDENSLEVLKCNALLEERNGNYAKATEYYCKIGESKDFNGFEAAHRASKKSGDKSLELYLSLLLKANLTETGDRKKQDQILSAIRAHGGKRGKADDKLHDILSCSLMQLSVEFQEVTGKLAALETEK